MKVHPRNEGTSKVDFILLLFMPIAIAVLTGAIIYLGMLTNAAAPG